MDLLSKGPLSFRSRSVGLEACCSCLSSQHTHKHKHISSLARLRLRYKFLSELDDPKAEGPALDLESSLDGASPTLRSRELKVRLHANGSCWSRYSLVGLARGGREVVGMGTRRGVFNYEWHVSLRALGTPEQEQTPRSALPMRRASAGVSSARRAWMATRRRTVHHCIAMKRCLGVFLHSFRPQGQGGQAPQELQTVQLEPGRQLETVNLGG